MKLRQYTKFTVRSSTLDPDQLTKLFGVRPDRAHARGSRQAECADRKPVPRTHMWVVECRDYKLSVSEQIKAVVERLQPARDAIRKLVAENDDASAVLGLARWFGGSEGEEQVSSHSEDPREDVVLFGWSAEQDVIDFLHDVGARLDVDEYDMQDDGDYDGAETDDPSNWRLDIPQEHIDLYVEQVADPRPMTADEATKMIELVNAWRDLEHRKHLALKAEHARNER